MTTTQQITTVVQSTVTTLQIRQHIVAIRQDEQGRYHVTTGRWGRQERIWTSYHDAKRGAVSRIKSMVAAEQHAEETSCDGLCPEVL